jgi:hypothetical protein
VLRQAIGRPPHQELPAPAPRRTAANWIVPLGGSGRYEGMDGLAEVLDHPDTEAVLPFLAPGDVVPAYPRFAGYPAFVLSVHESWQDCVRYQDWLAGTLKSRWSELAVGVS